MMKRMVSLSLFSLFVTVSTPALAREEESLVYIASEVHHWSEHAGGKQLLSEDGVLMSVGFRTMWRPTRRVQLVARTAFFAGTVDYDGHNQAGVAHKSSTTYLGARGDFDVHVALVKGKAGALRGLFGLGWHWWNRDLASQGADFIGYEEEWYVAEARLGLAGIVALGGGRQAELQLGARRPFLATNEAGLSETGVVGLSDVRVEPEGAFALFAEVAVLKRGDASLSLAYEGMRFDPSDPVEGFQQPESRHDLFSIRVGGVF